MEPVVVTSIIAAIAAVVGGAISAVFTYLAAGRKVFVTEYQTLAQSLKETREAERKERTAREALQQEVSALTGTVARLEAQVQLLRGQIEGMGVTCPVIARVAPFTGQEEEEKARKSS